MNNKGSGLMLIIILVVALLIGYLAMTHMDSLGFGKTGMQQEQTKDTGTVLLS